MLKSVKILILYVKKLTDFNNIFLCQETSNDFEIFCKHIHVIPITDADFMQASQIYANLRRDGRLIEDADIFIGASALNNNAILVTNNEEHFSRIAGLKIENWTK